MNSVMFKVLKGFLYGNVLGLLFGTAIYLLAAAVDAVAPLNVTPTILFSIVYATCVLLGVAKEYDVWLDTEKETK